MTLFELCRAIDMPQPVTERLSGMQRPACDDIVRRLCTADYPAAAQQLADRFGSEQHGLVVLAVMLEGALLAHRRYRECSIGDDIFFDTMRCFSRFVREYRRTYGEYGFDRWWWTGRQLSLRLFRLGALEYECAQGERGEEISVHIPSDADLGADSVQRSLRRADDFFARFEGGRYRLAPYVCSSWLLSPALRQLLGPQSRILRFQALFALVRTDEGDESYKQWLFGDTRLRPQDFPEDTSLQRSAKAFILAGGSIGEGFGVLRRHPSQIQ